MNFRTNRKDLSQMQMVRILKYHQNQHGDLNRILVIIDIIHLLAHIILIILSRSYHQLNQGVRYILSFIQ